MDDVIMERIVKDGVGAVMSWLHGWYVTLRYGREARRVLKEPFNPDDYVEVGPPEGD